MSEDNPIEIIYEFAEQAYRHQQVQDILERCIKQQSRNPMDELVEELILEGPASINVLQEVLFETDQRRTQIQDELHRVMIEIQDQMQALGLELPHRQDIPPLPHLHADVLIELMQQQGIDTKLPQNDKVQLLLKGYVTITNLYAQLTLLQDMENYLQDWLWGLAYQSFHLKYPNRYSRAVERNH